jgi:hypothetical protein
MLSASLRQSVHESTNHAGKYPLGQSWNFHRSQLVKLGDGEK